MPRKWTTKGCGSGSHSIETGTDLVALLLRVIDIICGAISMLILLCIGTAYSYIASACVSLLVIFAHKTRKPGLFVPCLMLGVVEVIGCVVMCYLLYGCVFNTQSESELTRTFSRNGSIFFLFFYAMCILLYVCFNFIILREFSAVKEAESGRSGTPV